MEPSGWRDRKVSQHVDAIRALIRPDWVLAVLAVDSQGRPYFMCPEWHRELLRLALGDSVGLLNEPPESP
jgi:hypothetical protein